MPRRSPSRLHPAAPGLAAEHRAGTLSRREFLTRATALGVPAGMAWALIGQPRPAQGQTPPRHGGSLRAQMSVYALPDTRAYDRSELGNLSRGTLEYLVQYENDGSFTPMLLEGWQANDDATEFRLTLRAGITWSNGDPLTARDVAFNVARWADRGTVGNSMAARVSGLIDPATGQLRDGAVEVTGERSLILRSERPDIALIPSLADYPAAIIHPSYAPGDPTALIGTGPYRIARLDPGTGATLIRSERPWWGTAIFGGPYLDSIEYVDVGTDPASAVAALKAGDVDLLYESVGDFVEALDALDLRRSEVLSGATIVVRGNQAAEIDGRRPYADPRMRRSLQLAVDNAICLELGYGNHGSPAENHHVGPMHPDYAELPPPVHDPGAARRLVEEAGMAGFEHQLVTLDDDWQRNTGDAVAALLLDAGLMVSRTNLPAARYWPEWSTWPFSATAWNHRPLGVQIHELAYRSGEAWNEFGWSNPEFDAALDEALSILDADRRREVMRRMEQLIRDDAVTIQPFWRKLFRHSVPGVRGAGQHVSYEHHHHKWGWAA